MKSKKLVSALLAVAMMGQVGVCAVPAFAAGTTSGTSSISLFKETSKVVLNEGVSITYNYDSATMKEALYKSLINFDESTLPENTTVDDFKFTYGTLHTDFDGVLGIGAISAGEQQINVSYKGNSDYYASGTKSATVTINKATMKLKVKLIDSIYCDETVPDDYVTVNPADDNINVFTVYAGVNTNLSVGAWVQLPDNMTSVITAIDKIGIPKAITGRSFEQILQDGITFGELSDLFTAIAGNDATMTILKAVGIDTSTLETIIKVLDKMPSMVDDVTIGFGTPNKAGLYGVVAVGVNSNYETGYGMGSLIVKMRLTGNKLTWTEDVSGSITEAQAAKMDLGAQLSRNGDVTISQRNVKIRYTGFTSAGKLYSSTKAPTKAGRYLESAMTVGGNYFATPITRTFTITAE